MSEKEPVLAWHSEDFYPSAHQLGAQRVNFIEHKGKRILLADFSHTDLEMVRATAAEYLHVLKMQPANSVLSLIAVEEIAFSPEAVKVGTELTELGQPYSMRTAISGVSGFRSFVLQTMLKATNRPAKLFQERAEAMEWLIAGEAEKG